MRACVIIREHFPSVSQLSLAPWRLRGKAPTRPTRAFFCLPRLTRLPANHLSPPPSASGGTGTGYVPPQARATRYRRRLLPPIARLPAIGTVPTAPCALYAPHCSSMHDPPILPLSQRPVARSVSVHLSHHSARTPSRPECKKLGILNLLRASTLPGPIASMPLVANYRGPCSPPCMDPRVHASRPVANHGTASTDAITRIRPSFSFFPSLPVPLLHRKSKYVQVSTPRALLPSMNSHVLSSELLAPFHPSPSCATLQAASTTDIRKKKAQLHPRAPMRPMSWPRPTSAGTKTRSRLFRQSPLNRRARTSFFLSSFVASEGAYEVLRTPNRHAATRASPVVVFPSKPNLDLDPPRLLKEP